MSQEEILLKICLLTQELKNFMFNRPVRLKREDFNSSKELEELEVVIENFIHGIKGVHGFLESLYENDIERIIFLENTFQGAKNIVNPLPIFGDCSNKMRKIMQKLDEREQKLKEASEDMEKTMRLLLSILDRQKNAVIAVDRVTKEVYHLNQVARRQFCDKDGQLDKNKKLAPLFEELVNFAPQIDTDSSEMQTTVGEKVFNILAYNMQWQGIKVIVYQVADITDELKEKQKLSAMAYIDPLTRVYNRRYGLEFLQKSCDNHQTFSLVMIDIDNLKYVNDKWGHLAGDEYICNSVQVIQKHLRTKDAICRMGGDEFLVFMPDCVEQVALRRMKGIREEILKIEKSYPLSLSYGVVYHQADDEKCPEELLRRIDEHMYAFKRRNKKVLAGGRV